MELIAESVRYSFDQSELVSIARNQARHHNDKAALEDQFDQVRAAHKSNLARVEADVSDCTRKITAGYEMRTVDCLVLKFRPDKDHALVVRTDSGRVLRNRKLASEEKQLKLSTEPPPPWVYEVDLYEDAESDIAECVAENVPLYEDEGEQLREVLELRPMRHLIADGNGEE